MKLKHGGLCHWHADGDLIMMVAAVVTCRAGEIVLNALCDHSVKQMFFSRRQWMWMHSEAVARSCCYNTSVDWRRPLGQILEVEIIGSVAPILKTWKDGTTSNQISLWFLWQEGDVSQAETDPEKTGTLRADSATSAV